MNVWKPIALVAVTGLVASLGIQVASASSNPYGQSNLTGPCHDQPNMAAAKEKLMEARGFLAKAEHNKGGWRDIAIQSTDAAIAQTNKGCEVANDR
jgi:hypothetical protein